MLGWIPSLLNKLLFPLQKFNTLLFQLEKKLTIKIELLTQINLIPNATGLKVSLSNLKNVISQTVWTANLFKCMIQNVQKHSNICRESYYQALENYY